jgi:hypothetical protein
MAGISGNRLWTRKKGRNVQPAYYTYPVNASQFYDQAKKAPEIFRRPEAREMRSSEFVTYQKTYLLSAMGLAPRSRRLLTAARAARVAGMFAAAAP